MGTLTETYDTSKKEKEQAEEEVSRLRGKLEEKQQEMRGIEKEIKSTELENIKHEKNFISLQKELEGLAREVKKKTDANQTLEVKHQENIKYAEEI